MKKPQTGKFVKIVLRRFFAPAAAPSSKTSFHRSGYAARRKYFCDENRSRNFGRTALSLLAIVKSMLKWIRKYWCTKFFVVTFPADLPSGLRLSFK
ncbi:MAG: hypothetical protein IPJ82_16605 [Lewinellaceae bacterium]|nr:hypothetical protein [Lewinellaceae bacterium]